MNALTREWIEKAEADLTVAGLALATRNETLASDGWPPEARFAGFDPYSPRL